jgi:hypothetical protein
MAQGIGLEIASFHGRQLKVFAYILKPSDGKRLARIDEGAEFRNPPKAFAHELRTWKRSQIPEALSGKGRTGSPRQIIKNPVKF